MNKLVEWNGNSASFPNGVKAEIIKNSGGFLVEMRLAGILLSTFCADTEEEAKNIILGAARAASTLAEQLKKK